MNDSLTDTSYWRVLSDRFPIKIWWGIYCQAPKRRHTESAEIESGCPETTPSFLVGLHLVIQHRRLYSGAIHPQLNLCSAFLWCLCVCVCVCV